MTAMFSRRFAYADIRFSSGTHKCPLHRYPSNNCNIQRPKLQQPYAIRLAVYPKREPKGRFDYGGFTRPEGFG